MQEKIPEHTDYMVVLNCVSLVVSQTPACTASQWRQG